MKSKLSKNNNYLALFGQALRKARLDAGLSQEDLAAEAEIDRSYLGAVERGQHNITLLNILRLSFALKISPQSLFSAFSKKSKKEGG